MKRPPISLTEKLALKIPFCHLYFSQESTVFVDYENNISYNLTSIFLFKEGTLYVGGGGLTQSFAILAMFLSDPGIPGVRSMGPSLCN